MTGRNGGSMVGGIAAVLVGSFVCAAAEGTPGHTPPPDVGGRAPIAELAAAPLVPLAFENRSGAPLVIEEARIPIVALAGDQRGMTAIGSPTVRLRNLTARPVQLVRLSLRGVAFEDVVGVPVDLAAYGKRTVPGDTRSWSNVVASGNEIALRVSVVGVRFRDGEWWGAAESTPPAAPRAPKAPTPSPLAPREVTPELPAEVDYVPATFENLAGAPMVIERAAAPVAANREPPSPGECWLPIVTMRNASAKRVVALKLRFKADAESHAVIAVAVDVAPGERYTFTRHGTMSGDPHRMKVQVVAVRLGDRTVWGDMDGAIDTRVETVPPRRRDGGRSAP